MTALKNFFVSLFLSVILFSAVATVGVNAQIDLPNTCNNGSCPLIGTAPIESGSVTQSTVSNFILAVARFLTYIVAALAVLFLVYGGFLFVTDGGDGKRADNGKKILTNAVIGLILAIVSFTIVQVVGTVVSGNIAGGFISNN